MGSGNEVVLPASGVVKEVEGPVVEPAPFAATIRYSKVVNGWVLVSTTTRETLPARILIVVKLSALLTLLSTWY